MKHILDLHMHVVPGIDDGARSIEEAIEMLRISAQQGITDIFCTSHNGYSLEDGERYTEQLAILRDEAKSVGINIQLHRGCEILCAGEYIDDIIYGLNIGAFATLGNSKYVLTEFYSDARPSEALTIIAALTGNGYKPIIAHMERNYNITGIMVNTLIMSGALIQVNAYSFVEEKDEQTKMRARELLKNKYVHFIGSDAHRIDHRPPMMSSGMQYIIENTDNKYAAKILAGSSMVL